MPRERKYVSETLPFNENLEKFGPVYQPEFFTEEEKRFLKPFFSNFDKPVFVTHSLPEEVNAALDSRYSRSVHSKRRLFLKEYVTPIIKPEETRAWKEAQGPERQLMLGTKEKFIRIIDFLNSEGGLDYVVNIQRARNFFDVWLSSYGDDSIAEMGAGLHVSMEGISSVVLEEVVSKRIGISPLVKSTRYVRFDEKKKDGGYQYFVPGEIKGTDMEKEYRASMNALFDTYSHLLGPYLDYIKELYPRGEDETEKSFTESRRAKTFDDLRDLLPFATENNMGLAGNGRAFEDLVNRLLGSPLGEARWWGKEMAIELSKIVPSFMVRPGTARGAEIQNYRSNLEVLRNEMSEMLLKDMPLPEPQRWTKLLSYTPDAEVEIISSFLFTSDSNKSLAQIREKVKSLNIYDRIYILQKIIQERRFGKLYAERKSDRFKKVPRAFENAHYLFEIWGRGGDMRDLHRHRQSTEGHPPFTAIWGFDLEKEAEKSPFSSQITGALKESAKVFEKLKSRFGPDVAQYSVAFGFLQHWYMNLSAREIYWIGELRTGPQARPHYKEITLSLAAEALKADPNVFGGLMLDKNDYRLARRESAKKTK